MSALRRRRTATWFCRLLIDSYLVAKTSDSWRLPRLRPFIDFSSLDRYFYLINRAFDLTPWLLARADILKGVE